MRFISQRKEGFTLVELLVVMTIIVILATIGIVSYTNASQSARDGKRRADIESVRQALVLYKQENTSYPPGGGGGINQYATNYNNATATLVTDGFLSAPSPVDPRNTSPYFYLYRQTSSGDGFCVCARMERSGSGNATDRNCNGLGSAGDLYCAVQP